MCPTPKNILQSKSQDNNNNTPVYICCLGLALNPDGSPPDELEARCSHTADLAKQNPEARILLSGGDWKNLGVTEAGVMAQILSNKGINFDRIILEEKSANTIENAYYLMRLVAELGVSENQTAPSEVFLVTSRYHIPRAAWLFRFMAQALEVSFYANCPIFLKTCVRLFRFCFQVSVHFHNVSVHCTQDLKLSKVELKKADSIPRKAQLVFKGETEANIPNPMEPLDKTKDELTKILHSFDET